MRISSFWTALRAAALAALLAGCSSSQRSPAPAAPANVEEAPKPLPTRIPLPPPPPNTLAVTGFDLYRDTYGRLTVVGTVHNGTDAPVSAVELVITARGPDGGTVLEDWRSTPAEQISFEPVSRGLGPGESSPFIYVLGEVELARYGVGVGGYEAGPAKPRAVAIRNAQLIRNDLGDLTLVGEVFNTSATPVTVYQLHVAGLAADGEVVALEYISSHHDYLGPAGSPSSSAPIEFDFGTTSKEIVGWQVYAYTEPTEPVDYKVSFSAFTSYLDSERQTHLLGLVTNQDDAPLVLYLTAAAYDAEGRVLSRSFSGSRYIALPPGATLPVEFRDFISLDYTAKLVERVHRWGVQVDVRATDSVGAASLPLQASAGAPKDGLLGWALRGELLNDTGRAMERAVVVVALVDGAGNPVLVGFDSPPIHAGDTLTPGERMPYSIALRPAEGQPPTDLKIVIYAYGNPLP